MDYRELAQELVQMRAEMQQLQFNREISKSIKGEAFVLYYLMQHERTAYPKVLSQQMHVSTARIATILNHLESKQLIVRMTDPADSRQVIVTLTDTGAEEIRRQREKMLGHVVHMLKLLGEEDAQAYVRIQKKILHMFLTQQET
ncbi:MAG: MarR family winged helix-turn-helix transcriptional regulator [Butyricicoccaceae bacterium]